jgi:hypothetical protein
VAAVRKKPAKTRRKFYPQRAAVTLSVISIHASYLVSKDTFHFQYYFMIVNVKQIDQCISLIHNSPWPEYIRPWIEMGV